ncbi:MAG: Glu/Leu/Phe/Val dehydrogenase [Deltaproteobacteria bacterium]|nr:Glu/Leu/Phe/Val dehydrogenase [Deltaproteobacteria bacterium]MBW1986501.1 Glu/Leu/Phe/Val dehydrogenase [Deltaproteobacteria bacterium]MBW2135079.1 Glu/Leu/Phe/Val dehydrogenase [Deltaproteobacteria bacterium]
MNLEEVIFNQFGDEWGPHKIIHLYKPSIPLQAIVVVDNIALGPAIGGVRLALEVTTEEVFRLARTMTWKNAAAGLAHGGAKAGIRMAADSPAELKERAIRAFANGIAELQEYIPGPDMGTNETHMAYIYDEIGRSVGRPKVTGGIPLDELGVTGYGLTVAAEILAPEVGLRLEGARMAIQGFGNVGKAAAFYLAQKGVLLVAASDSAGAIYNPAGIDVNRLTAIKKGGGKVLDYREAEIIPPETLFALPCDLLIPAARPDVITQANMDQIKASLVLEGANLPVTPEAESYLHDRGICAIPDFIVNAGGVIACAVEYHHGTEAEAFQTIAAKIRDNIHALLPMIREEKLYPRQAAFRLAQQRVKEAQSYRRTF